MIIKPIRIREIEAKEGWGKTPKPLPLRSFVEIKPPAIVLTPGPLHVIKTQQLLLETILFLPL